MVEYLDKGSMPCTVLVSQEPDKSGNFVCNGAADNIEIQAAIFYVEALGSGLIHIKAGISYYLINSTIEVAGGSSGIIIEGEGFGTRLLLANNVNSSLLKVGTSASRIFIRDIRLSGKYNMITDAKEITKELNIDLKYYLSILLNLENYLEVK